ncbi:hypothetical protein [Gellertiella hungarica]|uniref:Heme exporter protein D n=1 Tax=Gellertiella hungarica TaxID=1572859 RepID=A0A7W6NK38_9HYPH|nr:hypothetical protein [Gellertiella hungarica]MBB4065045.1 hypothetical protein [Gellertiella hungarica]
MDCTFNPIEFYRVSPDWIKVVWILSIPLFVAAMTAIVLRYRIERERLALSARAMGETGV